MRGRESGETKRRRERESTRATFPSRWECECARRASDSSRVRRDRDLGGRVLIRGFRGSRLPR